MFSTVLLVIHVLIAVALVVFVLLQHGKGADAGAAFGAGASGTVFGARGASNFLSRSTAALAAIFFITSLSLAFLSGQTIKVDSVMDSVQKTESVSDVPALDGVDLSPSSPDVPAMDSPKNSTGQSAQ